MADEDGYLPDEEYILQWLTTVSEKRFESVLMDDMRRQIDGKDLTRVPVERREVWRRRHAALRHPVVQQRWRQTLETKAVSLDGQLASNEAKMLADKGDALAADNRTKARDVEVRYNRWRSNALVVRTHVQESLIEARALSDSRVAELESAIRQHRDNFPNDDDPSDDDKALWSHVEQVKET